MINLKYSETFDIAIGRSRNETNWKVREWTWEHFVNKVSKEHRTPETHAEYMAAKKPRQDEIKDIGGFVGGRLVGGRRKAKNVLHRQLVTLDLDFVKPGFADELELAFNNAACVYSTHKHSDESPRLRLLMPLDREVRPDEYEAIARKIAGILDIEVFDPTTFQPERLMYWPSASVDGDFEFFYQDAPFICADDILGMYHDWTDSSQWPVSVKVDKLVRNDMKKQGDPLEKENIIGAFCRTYTISEAIEKYLSDYYEEGGVEDRYTYTEGSTANGLVVYDDKFAYSHHGTDPVSMKLVNAFDLVRVHMFGLKDENAREATPSTRLPSFAAMQELLQKDKAVRRQLGIERLQRAQDDFADMIEDEEPELIDEEPTTEKEDPTAWLEKLDNDKNGKCLSTIKNVAIILENDPKLKGRFAYNSFTQRKELTKNLPWRKVDKAEKSFRDDDAQNLNKYLENYYNITNRANIKDALDTHFAGNSYHPVKTYLDALDWDELPRLDMMLIEYLGAQDTPYTRAVTRAMLIAGVARIYRPGCKVDNVLTLIGEEGKGKSTLISMLGGEWFSDSFNFSMLHGNQAYEQIQGVWIIEIGELIGFKKADQDAIKNYISKREDIYRKAYAENVLPRKRQCIFIGSTNNRNFLRGTGGDRRWWPVDILASTPARDVFSQLTLEEIRQIWAEAKHYFEAGEKWHLTKEMEAVAKEMQQDHIEIDDRVGVIQRYLDTLLPSAWDGMELYAKRAFLRGQFDEEQFEGTEPKNRVCILEIWTEALDGDLRNLTRMMTKDLHDIMRQIPGWKPYQSKTDFKGFGTQRGYFRETKLRQFLVKNTAVVENRKN